METCRLKIQEVLKRMQKWSSLRYLTQMEKTCTNFSGQISEISSQVTQPMWVRVQASMNR